MASLSINNHAKYSLEIISKPLHSCVQQNKSLSPTKTTHRSQKYNRDYIITRQNNSKYYSRHFPKLCSEEMWPPSFPDLNPMDFCVLSFLETKALFCCTHERRGFETVSGSRMGQNTSGTLPCSGGRISKKT